MAKQAFIKLECDYCKNTATFPVDRPLSPSEQKESDAWILVALNNGAQEHYCTPFHASLALKSRTSIKLTDEDNSDGN